MHQYGATIPQKDIERLAPYLARASRERTKGTEALAYVADEDLNEVLVVSVDGGKLRNRIAVGKAPHGIAVTPDGSRAYVANMGSHDVSVIDLKLNRVIAPIPTGPNAHEVAITPDGRFAYVSNHSQASVSADRKSTRLNSSHSQISYAVFCLK